MFHVITNGSETQTIEENFVDVGDPPVPTDISLDGYSEGWVHLGMVDRLPEPGEVWDEATSGWVVDQAKLDAHNQQVAENEEEAQLAGKRRKLMRKSVRKALKLQADMELELGSIGQGQYDARIAWIQTNVPDID